MSDWLGVLCFSEKLETSPFASLSNLPCARIFMSPLGGETSVWQSVHAMQDKNAMQNGQSGEVYFQQDAHVLFGVIALDETLYGSAKDTPLQIASKQAYEHIFATMQSLKFPHLLRCWNYFSNINGVSDGLERYRQFNLGRQQAFERQPQLMNYAPPAACAIGTQHDPRGLLTVAFLATRTSPIALENPRQIHPRDYPTQYGPRSPLFSRGCLTRYGNRQQLFLSGTASITGHQTLHRNDVVAQTEETILNITAVLDAANAQCNKTITLDELEYTVYIRHAMHFPLIRATLENRIGKKLKAFYLQADICRADLLLEIEGFADCQEHAHSDHQKSLAMQ